MRKTFILDTSVLLYDSTAIHSFPGNDIVLPHDGGLSGIQGFLLWVPLPLPVFIDFTRSESFGNSRGL